eukprot:TRINITY_DN15131_c0_g1_i1.p1 TRINITY_DN15131_c0_g1~~TRINITY_DN15131_c0_g1_i1.p1  ORF type:complete len:187 (+),score=56.79 TRINITY_DN15131_c0_g1_i1:80-640(+)
MCIRDSYEAAVEAGAKEVAIFGAASETFSHKNLNCDIATSLDRFAPLLHQVSLGDTIGVGTPGSVEKMLMELTHSRGIPPGLLGIHCHNTYGQALANIHTALQMGVATVDSSVSGLGGCPYAPGARGNVATEDVLFMLDGMGVETGVDMNSLLEASVFISDCLGRQPQSNAATALLAKREREKTAK